MSRDDPWLRLEAMKLAVSGRLLRPHNDGPEGVAEDVKAADAFLDWIEPPPKKKPEGSLGWAIAKGLRLGHGIRRERWPHGTDIRTTDPVHGLTLDDLLADDWQIVVDTVYRTYSTRTTAEGET